MVKSKKTLTNTSCDPYQIIVSLQGLVNLKVSSHSTMASKVENTAGVIDHQPAILIDADRPLLLESGISIAPAPIAYQTFG